MLKTGDWHKIPLSLSELVIDTTLRCGQSFRWQKIDDAWHCTLHGRLISLRQDATHLHYRAIHPATTSLPTPPRSSRSQSPARGATDDSEALLTNYFNLDHDLSSLYSQWSLADSNFRLRAPKFTGVRILNQDVWEALVCFICSSNNNIARIGQMVHKLCVHYGKLIAHVGDEPFYDFPTPAALAGGKRDGGNGKVEAHLRELGFGYRARYIAKTARIVAYERESGWLDSLRNPESEAWSLRTTVAPNKAPTPPAEDAAPATYKAAHEALLSLPGVGPKVADCVCLFGLGWAEAVPVDTHVWQIAVRDYKFGKGKAQNKTFSKVMYDAVGDHFRTLWGKQAGWAHSVLFTADLKTFAGQAGEGSVEREVVEMTVKKEGNEQDSEGVSTSGTPVGKRKRTMTLELRDNDLVSKVKEEEDTEILKVVRTRSRRRKIMS